MGHDVMCVFVECGTVARLVPEAGLEGPASGSRRRVTATRFVNYDGLAETLQAAYQGSHRLQVEAQRLNINSMIGTSQRHKYPNGDKRVLGPWPLVTHT